MSDEIITAKGVNITVSFDGRMLTVIRQKATRKTEKRVPIASVKSVGWTEPGRMRPGHIAFNLLGDDDEVEATFVKKATDEWSALREAVEAAIVDA